MMIRRAGVTLIEVLVAIFIMGVGLLALLTLFPLGALTMAQAIKDDRTAQAAANAEAIAVLRDLRVNGTVTGAFLSPGAGLPNLNATPGGLEGPSYPVYLDPFGVLGAASNLPLGRITTGTFRTPGIPRRNITAISGTFANALRWFSLLDEMEFTEDGVPKRIGNEVQRVPQYTWAYLLRRPDASVTSVVDVAVVVYSGRPLQLPPDENRYTYGPVTFDTNSTEVEVRWTPGTGLGQQKPPVRKGSWILDATVLTAPLPAGQPSPHGFFYRVVNVTDLPTSGGQDGVVLSLQTRPKKGTTQGVLVVMEYVAEVFERGGDWKP